MGLAAGAAWSISLVKPWWLASALAGAVPILVSLRAARAGRHIPPGHVAMQCLAVLAVAIALTGPEAPVGPAAARPMLILTDVSASVRRQADRPLNLPEDVPREAHDFAAGIAPAGRTVDPNQTNLAPALHLALARRTALAAVVLRTDGRFTDADWAAVARAVGQERLPFYIVPMDSPPPDGRIAAFEARRQSDGKVRLRVTVLANSLQRRTLAIRRIRRGGPGSWRAGPPEAPLAESRLDLLPDEPGGLTVTDEPQGPATVPSAEPPPAAGTGDAAVVYVAELSPPDAFPANDTAEAIVLPTLRRVALIGSGSIGRSELAAAAGLHVERLAPDSAPQSADGWLGFAAVVLADPTGTVLGERARAALAEYVRCGGGLVLIGAGPHESAEDRSDKLNSVAALLANPYQRRPVRVILVLDASGSMNEPTAPANLGRVKFDQAAEAVLSLRRHLTPADRMAVIAFSDSAQAVYDSGDGPPDFAAVREALGRITPGGPTDVMPALRQAAARPAEEGRDTLVLVLSDLMTRPFRADQAAAMLRRPDLSLAIVAVASPADTMPSARPGSPGPEPPLETLARLLGAPPVVRRDSLTGLAGIFARLLRQARGPAIRRGSFRAAAVGQALFDLPPYSAGPPALPETRAYLLCAAQGQAEVLARVSDEADPLLAARRVGLGRTVSLALSPDPGENPAWEASGELVRLTAAAVRWVCRAGDDPRFAGRADRDGNILRVRLDAADANGPMNLLELTGRLVCAAGDGNAADAPVAFPLSQTAPGRYEAAVPAPTAAAALAVSLGAGQEGQDGSSGGKVVWQTALGRLAPPELAEIGPHWANLRRLAELTGGRIVRAGELQALGRQLASAARSPLWPAFMALAAAIMLLEWALAKVWRLKV